MGNGKTVTVIGIALNGADAGNYQVPDSTTTTANITARLLVAIVAANNRMYDGTTTATATLNLQTFIAGDQVNANFANALFDSRNVGNGRIVTMNGISLSGSDAGNYQAPSSATTTANITARPLTVSATAENKVYDGNTNATATVALAGVVAGDDVTASHSSALFNNKTVGTNKPVAVSGISLNGDDSGNYTAGSTATATANITAKPLTVTAIGQNKVYDGTTTATVTLTVSGTIGADDVTATHTSASFNRRGHRKARERDWDRAWWCRRRELFRRNHGNNYG